MQMDLYGSVLLYLGPQSKWKCESQFYIFFEPEKSFYTVSHRMFSPKINASHCQFRLWDSHYTGSITFKSFNSHPRNEDVYGDDIRINYFPTYVSSFFMGLHDGSLWLRYWLYVYVSNQRQLLMCFWIFHLHPNGHIAFSLCSTFLFS